MVTMNEVEKRLLWMEISEHCGSESLSKEGLLEIIERYGLKPNYTYVSNDYVFFLAACHNERINEGIIKCLLEYFPGAASATSERGWSPLHCACFNPIVSLGIIHAIVDAAPNSVSSEDNEGWMPLHAFCGSDIEKNETAAVQKILKLLIEKYPEALRHADNDGDLPIHLAAGRKSPEFCRLLIEAYPESAQITDDRGALPLHIACRCNTVATVEYLYRKYPDAINHATTDGHYPIHCTIVFHALCTNDRYKPAAAVETVRFLLDCDPNVKLHRYEGESLLRYACGIPYNDSKVETGIQMIKTFLNVHPESARSVDNNGLMPLHALSSNAKIDQAAAMPIVKMLIEKCPEAVRHADNDGGLPIHFAAGRRSPEFCRLLIEAYPGSEQIPSADGLLPLHLACQYNTVATVEYLYRSYPGAIDHVTADGAYPIHYAIYGANYKNNPIAAVETVQFLLDCHPNEKRKKGHGQSLLYFACEREYNETNVEAGIQMIKTLFDAHPKAIERKRISADIETFHQQVQAFINGELVYARQAKDHRLMTTPDDNGQLPLHRALRNNVRLGSIKLLVKGNPSAIRNSDNNLAMALHIACEHHNSASVVQYLLDQLDTSTLRALDVDNNTALHYACRGAKHHTIALLLERFAASVSKRNVEGKLPIDLLWGNKVSDRESVEYTESVFQLLKADPEMLAISNWTDKQPNDADATRNGKKRKRN